MVVSSIMFKLNYAYGLNHHRRVTTRVEKRRKEEVRTAHHSLRLDEFVEVGLDEGEPLLDTSFDVSPTIPDISYHLMPKVSSTAARKKCMQALHLRERQRSASASQKI